MRILLHSSSFYIFGAVVLIGIALYLLFNAFGNEEKAYVSAVADRGEVAEIVSVSGVVEAKNTADLAFPVSGVVRSVFAVEGRHVKKGDVLASLTSSKLSAERLDALAALQKATAEKDELVAGPTVQGRNVTNTTVGNAKANLEQVTQTENEKVENAQRIFISSGLEAYGVDKVESSVAPTITGTYTCDTQGLYTLSVYSSGSRSGYSYSLAGLNSGTYSAQTNSPGTLGDCGLFIQFDTDSRYSSTQWEVPIPNTRSSVFQTNLNTYELALQQKTDAIIAAENALTLAQDTGMFNNAPARDEALTRANAAILQAQARIQSIDAQIADRSIVAPFDGIITNVSILPGETANATPIITLLASDTFDLTTRIPEIDITKIKEGQHVSIIFDAQSDETINATIDFISPLATEIDGVAYFEATVTFNETPSWLRSGLNADVDIEVEKVTDVIRIPKRFLLPDTELPTVLVQENDSVTEKQIEIGFTGNDGFVEIIGLNEGTTVVAP
ncbi:MAG: HlyD family secretion protein [Candidatus Azotimanducaceae bacterium]|jgi:HlyD family secretion protein